MENERTFFVENYDLKVYGRRNYYCSDGYNCKEFDKLEDAQVEFNSRKDELNGEFVDRKLFLRWKPIAGVGVRICLIEDEEFETLDVEEIDRDHFNAIRYEDIDDTDV